MKGASAQMESAKQTVLDQIAAWADSKELIHRSGKENEAKARNYASEGWHDGYLAALRDLREEVRRK